MPHPHPSSRGKRLTPQSSGLLQKFFAFVGQEPPQAQPDPETPRLQTVVAQLRTELITARFPQEPAEEDRIHALVERYVDLMKAGSQPSEQVVIALKRILRDAGIWPDGQPGLVSSEPGRLWDNVVGWCIQRYYFTDA